MLRTKLIRSIQNRAASNEGFKSFIERIAKAIGYDLTHLARKVCWQDCHNRISALGPANLDVLEISAGAVWRKIAFRSYLALDYPEFDICGEVDPALNARFDLIIAEHVFEHLLWPNKAGKNVLKMLKPGGHFLIMTPFLIRIHEVPYDCSRWTETGMRYFLADCGFPLNGVETFSWGNLDALKNNLVTWSRVGWRKTFPNDPRFPISVWAMARKD